MLLKKYFFFFIYVLYHIYNDCSRWSNKTYRSGLSITEWELFAGFLPPLSESSWIGILTFIKKFLNLNYKIMIWQWMNSKQFFGGRIHRFLGRLIEFLVPLIYFTYRTSFMKMFNLYLIFLNLFSRFYRLVYGF